MFFPRLRTLFPFEQVTQILADGREAELPDTPDCLAYYPLRHLAPAERAVGEHNRDLPDPVAHPRGTEIHLDLE